MPKVFFDSDPLVCRTATQRSAETDRRRTQIQTTPDSINDDQLNSKTIQMYPTQNHVTMRWVMSWSYTERVTMKKALLSRYAYVQVYFWLYLTKHDILWYI